MFFRNIRINITGTSEGVTLYYYFDSAQVADSPDIVSSDDNLTHIFDNLTPSTPYQIGVKPSGEKIEN
ncbi:MAG: hypothetical protein LBS55_08435 [Prevotellaceae bacterium]|nr:hypothetical protein [Prevotellaceae bacterium]